MKVRIGRFHYDAKVTTEHASSSYNIPVLVILTERSATAVRFVTNRGALGTADAEALGVRIVQADSDEVQALARGRYRLPWERVGCRERVCTCHDDGAWTDPTSYPVGCSGCGCHRDVVQA